MPVAITCQHCGGQKLFPPSIAKDRKFCSSACKYESFRTNGWPRENHTFKPCEVCGEAVKVHASEDGRKRFCSQRCMLVWRGPVLRDKRFQPEKHETRRCKFCDRPFSTNSCRVKDGRGEYCSRACVGSATIAGFGSARVSKAELAFGEILRENGLHFEPQARFGVWSVDYFFREKMLAVEFDGDYWHSLPRVKKLDAKKDAYFASIGCKVLRIPEHVAEKTPLYAVDLVRQALG